MFNLIKKRERTFYFIMTFLVAVTIFFSSSIQTSAGEGAGLNLASAYHLAVFFMLTFFLSLSLIKDTPDIRKISVILLISLAYAISDEFHQLFVPERFSTLKDILIDFVGSTLSLILLIVIEKIKNKK